jgi:cadmium resistance protein CadD (predicted permease)
MGEFIQDVITALALAAMSFASTNVDNLLIVAALLQGERRIRDVAGGFAAASGILLLIAWSFTAIAHVLPPTSLAWLGLLPIMLGLRMLLAPAAAGRTADAAGLSAMAVTVLLLANSADTLAVLGPLFAESERHVVVTLAIGYMLSAAVSLLLIARFSARVMRGLPLVEAAERMVPFLMIAIGTYVLMNTGTDIV